MKKNKNYCEKELISLSEDYKIRAYLFYDKGAFCYLKAFLMCGMK
jgi:hypothetical protein